MTKKTTNKLVYIEWADATSPAEGWFSDYGAIEWAETQSYWVESFGFLLKETKEYILLASNRSVTKLLEEETQYSSIHKIPKTWIRKRKEIKI